MIGTQLYGMRDLVASARAVRRNTILIAGDIPESSYDFRATPATRSVAETLVHIAWLWTFDRVIHEEMHLDSLVGFDFSTLLRKSEIEEKRRRSKADIIDLLQSEGERRANWLEQFSDDLLAERIQVSADESVSRFEMLLATKEHELQHRAQLTVLERLIGVVPRVTGLS